jgi:hypothetical protein
MLMRELLHLDQLAVADILRRVKRQVVRDLPSGLREAETILPGISTSRAKVISPGGK